MLSPKLMLELMQRFAENKNQNPMKRFRSAMDEAESSRRNKQRRVRFDTK